MSGTPYAALVIARSVSDEAIHSFFLRLDGLFRGTCHRARVRATRWLGMRMAVILPDGQIRPIYRFGRFVQPPFCKNILIYRNSKWVYIPNYPVPPRGAIRDRHVRGAGCGGRGGCYRRERPKRTAKSCGPDTPTLVSSFWEAKASWGRRWQKSPVAGEGTYKP
jgi:hypothetical protein